MRPLLRNLIILLLALTPTLALAATPAKINYQGLLTNAGGTPVSNGSYSVTFKIYTDSIGGIALWTETKFVTTSSGLFSTMLGSVTPIPDSIFDSSTTYLGIKVSSDPEIAPRTELASVPYSNSARGLAGGDIETTPGTLTLKGKKDDPKKDEIKMTADSSGSTFLMLSADGIDTIYSLTGFTTTGLFGKSPSGPLATTVRSSKSNSSDRLTTEAHSDGSLCQILMLGATLADTLYSVSTTATGAFGRSSNLNSSRSNAFRIHSLSNDSGSGMAFLAANGDTLYAVSTSTPTVFERSSNLNSSRSNAFRVITNSNGQKSSIVMVDSLNDSNVVISDVSGESRLKKDLLIGSGTQSPLATLHVNGTTYLNGVTTIATAGRIQSEASGGARMLGAQGNTPAQPAIGFFATNGVDDGGGGNGIYRPASNAMAFATGSTERMRISSSGYLGIGNSSPTERLSVTGNICATGTIVGSSAGCGVSDARFKKNITTLDNGLGLVMRLRGVRYDWDRQHFPERNFTDAHQVGFIAQEVKEVLPELVTQMSDGYYAVDYGRLAPVLVEAIKELKLKTDRIEELQQKISQIDQLKRQLAVMSDQVAKLLAAQSKSTGDTKLAANDKLNQTGGK